MRHTPGILIAVAVLLIIPRPSVAQSNAAAPSEPRIFVDVNLGGTARSLAEDRTFTTLFVAFSELATEKATYPKPSRANMFPVVDLGGGFMFMRKLGAGVSYNRTTYDDTVGLDAAIPHPLVLNASASGTGATGKLSRDEAAMHLFAVVMPVLTRRMQVRIFGGPSFFWYSADMVKDVSYAQTLTPQYTVRVSGFTSEKARGTGVGAHIGGDFTYFFTSMFGVGCGLRYSRANATLDREPISQQSQQIRVGSTTVVTGVRFRFGL